MWLVRDRITIRNKIRIQKKHEPRDTRRDARSEDGGGAARSTDNGAHQSPRRPALIEAIKDHAVQEHRVGQGIRCPPRRRRRLIRMVDHDEREESEEEQDQPNAATIGGAAKAPGRVECVTCAHTAGITCAQAGITAGAHTVGSVPVVRILFIARSRLLLGAAPE